MKQLNYFFFIIICSLCTFGMVGCQKQATTEPLKETRFLMGTIVSITLYDHQDSSILNEAFQRLQTLEAELSLNEDQSLLGHVNTNAFLTPIPISEAMYAIIEKGLYYSKLTQGTFDLSIGPLVNLWRIGYPDARVPHKSEIEATLPLINYQNIHLDPITQTVALAHENMILDLGAIAKGYAADQIASYLKSMGINHGLIDIGGNIYTLGTKTDGTLWRNDNED